MAQVLDLFMAQPFGARSLLQRIFGMAIHDGINNVQKSIDILMTQKIKDPILCEKIKQYVSADEEIKTTLKKEALEKKEDLVVTILQSDYFGPELSSQQIETVFNAYVAWNNAVENVSVPPHSNQSSETVDSNVSSNDSLGYHIDVQMREGAELFAHLKQLFKLYLRQRDKAMMLEIIEEVRPFINSSSSSALQANNKEHSQQP
jgi:Domain of unknown function in PX-proteins (DUF3818)